MRIGAMNNPKRDVYKEIKFIAEQKFDFLDLTIEPEKAYSDDVDIEKILELKKQYALDIIGHTPWNLPISNPFKSVREAAFEEYSKCLDIFVKLGVKYVNVHGHMPEDVSDPNIILRHHIDFFNRIVKKAKKDDVRIMVENTKGIFNELPVLAKILEEVPGLKLHWDVGHANIGNEAEKKTKLALHNFKDKISHMHFSDNNGQEDQHLPLGAGNINWLFILKTLKEYHYEKTVTLEIHSQDLGYLLFSRDKIRFLMKNLDKEG
jgi:sugar phosphate isomerase/epimerase